MQASKLQRYELLFVRLTWLFLIAGFLFNLLKFDLQNKLKVEIMSFREIIADWRFACFIAILVLTGLKYLILKRGLLENQVYYYINRIFWLLIVSFSIVFMNVGVWAYMLILFSILVTSLVKGAKAGLLFVFCLYIIHSSMFYIAPHRLTEIGQISQNHIENMLLLTILYFIYALFAIFCGLIYKDSEKSDNENKRLLEQLKEKYLQLELAQEEIKTQYNKLKSTNLKLEETNKKLSVSIAEFYTMQQISQAVSSILDIRELLRYLNDIIIGVMGVNYSTIILFDDKNGRLKVQTTNISNINELATLTDNINNRELLTALDEGRYLLENFVDPQQYEFTDGREVNSLICIPLNTKSRKMGLILVEHKYCNAFDEEKVRLLGVIAQQVGIVMENAKLYQRMRELATLDGLTGVYNRQYFQERMDKELNNALHESYSVSLAIFDIDHFKRFNDTFGHMFGDKVIISIVNAVASLLRKSDIMARYGGEEFILLFPRTNLSEAFEKVEALRKMIAQHVVKDNTVTATVTVSFGISCFNECALSGNELLRTADDALYEAKAAGRNCTKTASRINEPVYSILKDSTNFINNAG